MNHKNVFAIYFAVISLVGLMGLASPAWAQMPDTVVADPQPGIAPAPATPAPPTEAQVNQAQPAQPLFFYYCDKARQYYPQVQQCPGGWVAVPAGAPTATEAVPVYQAPPRRWAVRHFDFDGAEVLHSRPSAVTFEFFGRALLYSVNYDYLITNRIDVGVGFSWWQSSAWWDAQNSTVTVVPFYANFYFSDRLGRGFLTVGGDWVNVSNPNFTDSVFANNGVDFVGGGGYEMRESNGYILRFGGYLIAGKTSTLSPFVSVGYAF